MIRAALLAIVLVAGCGPGAEVVINVEDDGLVIPDELERVRIRVTNPFETDPTALLYDSLDLPICGSGLPGHCYELPLSVTLAPGTKQPYTPVRVVVDAYAAAETPVISDASVFTFHADQGQHLDFVLRHACLGTAFAASDLACDSTGSCVHVAPRGGNAALLGFDAATYDYGAVSPMEKSSRVFSLQNLGTQSSGPVAVNLVGAPEFSITVNSCQGIPLRPPCSVTVTFAPTVVGSRSATLTATALPGESASVQLVNLKQPAVLTAAGTFDFGSAALGTSSATYTWRVTNTGALPTGVPSLTVEGEDAADFSVGQNACATPLAPGDTCSISVTFTPLAPGVRTAKLSLDAMPGGRVALAMTGAAGYALTITSTDNRGTVTSGPAGIACGATCSTLLAQPTVVTLHARTTNGSGVYFAGWSGDCAGSFHDCTVTVSQTRSVTARFVPITSNLVFVSSTLVPATLGGVVPYDLTCNQLATAAGINNATNNAYIAWVSKDATTGNARVRLGIAAAGFSRLDGAPGGDTQGKLFDADQILNVINITEEGAVLNSGEQTWTSTRGNGMYMSGSDCTGWMSTAGATGGVGSVLGGPQEWSLCIPANVSCGAMQHVNCFMKTQVATVTPVAPAGAKVIFVATGFTPVGDLGGANAACDGAKPAAVAASTFKAFLATTTNSAASVLDPAKTYVRLDGVVVGTGADLAKGNGRIRSSPWQDSLGAYGGASVATVFTGASDPSVLGTPATTCNDWTNTSTGSGVLGNANRVDLWWNKVTSPCGTSALYCVEQ